MIVGNGAGLPITTTGFTTILTSSKNLLLDNVLCVPNMKKNLISVNKLCQSNGVMVQMCPNEFQVKDLNTGATILKGRANAGLYEWPTIPSGSSFISAFSTSTTSTPAWHARLGHPANSVIQLISSRFKIPMSFSTICNLALLIKVISYHFLNLRFTHIFLLRLFSPMYGHHRSTRLMAINTMLFLLTIIHDIHGFILSNKNLMLPQFFRFSGHWLRIGSKQNLQHCSRIMVVSTLA